jgi:outer membrane protein OmpA-like peptidoglycan-associated protein
VLVAYSSPVPMSVAGAHRHSSAKRLLSAGIPMRLRNRSRSWVYFIALVVGLGFGAASARAQTAGADSSFEVQLFQSAIGPRGYFTVDSAQVPAHKQFNLSLVTNYQRSPFSIYTVKAGDSLSQSVDVVRNQISSELTGAIGLLGRFQLGVAIPLTLFMDGQRFNSIGQPDGTSLSASGIGDVRFEGKAFLTRFGPDEEFALSVAPGITLPTGNESKFLGDATVTGRIRAISEFEIDDFRASTTLGFLFRDPSESFAANVGQQFLYGLGVEYRVHRQVSVLGEFFGRSGLSQFSKRWVDANPAELDGGMRVRLPHMLTATLGMGVGLVKGIGSPKARVFLALAWNPDFRDRDEDGVYDVEDRCPDEPEDVDGHKDRDGCPEVDNDGDGLLDGQDKCPLDPEDLDQFEDEDGCPEADNDKDGIPDLNDPCPNAAEDGGGKRPKDGCPTSNEDSDGDGVQDARDKCVDEPEDRDGFQDYDGCAEPDNDNDNIPDGFDACPNDAEDADGFEDSDGCPDPDNDKDGVSDAQDKCPQQSETLNGNRDEDGCPDPGAEIVLVKDDKIEVRERITFTKSGGQTVLTGGGTSVVNLVALVLLGNADISRVRIEVFADGASKEETQARADAVAKTLAGRGVDAKRLKGAGMGPGGNRVDFVIERRESKRKAAAAPSSSP